MADETLGVGLNMVAGLPLHWTMATGKTCLANSIARRLQTERGTLQFAPNEGLDVRDMLSEGLTQAGLAEWASAISDECEKDERVTSASVTLDPSADGTEIEISIELQSAAGDFKLVLNVDDLTVEILEVAA